MTNFNLKAELEKILISHSQQIIPEIQGTPAIKIDSIEAVVTKVNEKNLPVATLIYDLVGKFSAKKPILKKYVLYEKIQEEDGCCIDTENTFFVKNDEPSFFFGGYHKYDKEGTRVESGTIDEDGTRTPFDFL